MISKILEWAFALKLPANKKIVVIALAALSDSEGVSSGSAKTVASMASVVDRTVRRDLDDLEHAGLIKREKCFSASGAQLSNRVRLAIDKDPALFDFLKGEPRVRKFSASFSAVSPTGGRADGPSVSGLAPAGIGVSAQRGSDTAMSGRDDTAMSRRGDTAASMSGSSCEGQSAQRSDQLQHCPPPPDTPISSCINKKTTTTAFVTQDKTDTSVPAESLVIDDHIPAAFRASILRIVSSSGLKHELAQAVLDECAGTCRLNALKKRDGSPTGLAYKLTQLALAEAFEPSAGIAIAHARHRKAQEQIAAAQKREESSKRMRDRKAIPDLSSDVKACINKCAAGLGLSGLSA